MTSQKYKEKNKNNAEKYNMSVKYNMQPCDWPVYRDLVMTSPYDDVIIHKLQYAITWLVEYTGGEGGQTSRHGAVWEEKKEK